MNLAELASQQVSRLATERERNRADAAAHGMGCVAAWLDALRAGGFSHASIAYIDDGNGWSIGKRDPGPWCEYRPDGRWGATQSRVRKARAV